MTDFPLELLDGNEAWGFPPAPAHERIELELVDDETNARRFYRMSLRPDPTQLALFAEPPAPVPVLVVERGRIAETYVRDEYAYSELAPLAAKWRALLLQRRAHSYRVTRRL